MSEEKFSKCGEEKNVSVEFRVFGKKRNWKKSSEKKSKCFGVEILLSSCSLAGLYVNLQVKVTEEKCWKFSKYVPGGCLKLSLRFAWEI